MSIPEAALNQPRHSRLISKETSANNWAAKDLGNTVNFSQLECPLVPCWTSFLCSTGTGTDCGFGVRNPDLNLSNKMMRLDSQSVVGELLHKHIYDLSILLESHPSHQDKSRLKLPTTVLTWFVPCGRHSTATTTLWLLGGTSLWTS